MSTIERKFRVGAGLEFADGTSVTSATGLVGATGPQGPAGNTGQTGATGPQGETGATGPQGDQGIQGETGATGPQGDQGIQGETGATGPQGDQGIQGETGATGPQGIQGETGAAGATGATGPQGPTGLGFKIAKIYSSVSQLEADTAPSGIIAGEFALIDTGNVEDADNSKLYLWTGTEYEYVTDLSGAEGIQGPAGATGAEGAQGPAGATGPQGPTGATGAGFNGLTSNTEITIGTGNKTFTVNTDASASGFQVGSIVSVAAIGSPSNAFGVGGIIVSYTGTSLTVSVSSVTGSGTYSSWNFILAGRTGAQGATGAEGPVGATGPQGETGATGPQGPGANQSLDITSPVTFASVTATNGVSVSTPTAGFTYIPFKTDKAITFQVYRTGITSTATQNIMDMGLESASFNTFKYLITVIDNDNGTKRIHSQEMLSVVDGTNVYESEYAIVLSSDQLGLFNTIVNLDGSRSLEWVPAADITSATVIVEALALSD
jgi:hypothetical protein